MVDNRNSFYRGLLWSFVSVVWVDTTTHGHLMSSMRDYRPKETEDPNLTQNSQHLCSQQATTLILWRWVTKYKLKTKTSDHVSLICFFQALFRHLRIPFVGKTTFYSTLATVYRCAFDTFDQILFVYYGMKGVPGVNIWWSRMLRWRISRWQNNLQT